MSGPLLHLVDLPQEDSHTLHTGMEGGHNVRERYHAILVTKRYVCMLCVDVFMVCVCVCGVCVGCIYDVYVVCGV